MFAVICHVLLVLFFLSFYGNKSLGSVSFTFSLFSIFNLKISRYFHFILVVFFHCYFSYVETCLDYFLLSSFVSFVLFSLLLFRPLLTMIWRKSPLDLFFRFLSLLFPDPFGRFTLYSICSAARFPLGIRLLRSWVSCVLLVCTTFCISCVCLVNLLVVLNWTLYF